MRSEVEILGIRVRSRNFSEAALQAIKSRDLIEGTSTALSSTYIRLRKGVNVLFGPNGVGKTNLLRSTKNILKGFGDGRIYCKGTEPDPIEDFTPDSDNPALGFDRDWDYADIWSVWNYFSGDRAGFSSFTDFESYRHISSYDKGPKPWFRKWEQVYNVVEREVQEEITALGLPLGNLSYFDMANSHLNFHKGSTEGPTAGLRVEPRILRQILQQETFVLFPDNGSFNISLGFFLRESQAELASLITETLAMTEDYVKELKEIADQADLEEYELDPTWLNWVTGFTNELDAINTGRLKSSLLHDGSDKADWCDQARPLWAPLHFEAAPFSVFDSEFNDFQEFNPLEIVVWDIDDEWPYDDVEDVASHRLLLTYSRSEGYNPFSEDSVKETNKHFVEANHSISELANKYFKQFIPDAPLLKFGPAEILMGRKQQPKWYCSWIKDKSDSIEDAWWTEIGPGPFNPNRGVFLIEKLSPTVFRWARFSILLATMSFIKDSVEQSFSNVYFVCDEPERGFGRAEQKNLSRALNRISQEEGYNFIITTHSPEIIEDPSMHLNRVERVRDLNLGVDSIKCIAIDKFEKDSLHRLGLSTAEQLGLDRVYLLVEGMHDLWVLDEFFSEQLQSNRIRILPMQGAYYMARIMAPEAQFLFKQTDARFAFLLDNSHDNKFAEIFSHNNSEKNPLELSQMLQEIETDTTEQQVMKQIISSAIEALLLNRVIGTIGLEKLDILDYLPAQYFIPNREWNDLRSEHKNLRETARPSRRPPSDFKKWCELVYEAKFDEFAVRGAVNAMDEIPPEFTDLLNQLISAATIK